MHIVTQLIRSFEVTPLKLLNHNLPLYFGFFCLQKIVWWSFYVINVKSMPNQKVIGDSIVVESPFLLQVLLVLFHCAHAPIVDSRVDESIGEPLCLVEPDVPEPDLVFQKSTESIWVISIFRIGTSSNVFREHLAHSIGPI